jgi:hypothetical protein
VTLGLGIPVRAGDQQLAGSAANAFLSAPQQQERAAVHLRAVGRSQLFESRKVGIASRPVIGNDQPLTPGCLPRGRDRTLTAQPPPTATAALLSPIPASSGASTSCCPAALDGPIDTTLLTFAVAWRSFPHGPGSGTFMRLLHSMVACISAWPPSQQLGVPSRSRNVETGACSKQIGGFRGAQPRSRR